MVVQPISYRYQLHQPASLPGEGQLAGHILTLQAIASRVAALSDCNSGATLTTAATMRTHLSIEFAKLPRPMETPLCRMCFLFLHQQRACNCCETIISVK